MSERPAPVPHAEGQIIVMVYTNLMTNVVSESIDKIRAAGGRVILIGPQVRGYEDAAEAATDNIFLHQKSAPVYVDPNNRPRKYSAPWAKIVATNLTRRATFKPARKALGISTLWWMSASHNRTALHALDSANVITAVDGGAVYLCWQAARRNRRAAVINGVGPTMEHLGLAR